MTASIARIDREELQGLISSKIALSMGPEDLIKFRQCMASSTIVWGGMADGKLVNLWGLVPPTLLSDYAYLWMQMIEDPGEHEFVFVRHSQRAVEEALKHFPTIIGHCHAGARRSMRWVKWLGGVFGHPEGKLVPFTIVRKHG